MAAAIGNKNDAKKYTALAAKVSTAFQKAYLQADGKLGIHNQTAYAMALFFDLIPPVLGNHARVAIDLPDCPRANHASIHPSCGVVFVRPG